MSRRAVLFVESNTSGTGRLFARTARAMGYRPVLITARPERYGYLAERDAPEAIVVPEVTDAAIDALIERRFAGGRDVAGVTSSSEYGIAMAAGVAARAGLPGPAPGCVRAARDKSWQREVLAAHGLPVPAFHVVSSPRAAEAAARAIASAVVVKPLKGTGSIGVRACQTPREAGEWTASLMAAADAEPLALVESLIEGPEYSVEVFSGRIVGITRKHLGPRPSFVEIGHDYPAELTPAAARLLEHVVIRATACLGLGWGPLHWELRVRGGIPYVMEINPRLAGGFIPELVRHAQGIDLIRETLRLVVGEPPDVAARRHEAASIRFLTPPAAGELVAAEGLEEVRAADGIVDATLYRALGDDVALHGDFRDRIGHVIGRAADTATAASIAERARDAVSIRVTPAGGRAEVCQPAMAAGAGAA